jgi:pimeloyl-ACP methyl ester carboxylesterase
LAPGPGARTIIAGISSGAAFRSSASEAAIQVVHQNLKTMPVKQNTTATAVQPFTIDISKDMLVDLQQRLEHTRWIKPLKEEVGWDYGMNMDYLKELTDYWQHDYNWRDQERKLNRFDHFKAKIDDYHLHFIHQRGKRQNSIPLLLLHGWPDSFYRFHKIIPMLTDRSFDVIVPSLPGFGFTECPADRGMEEQPIRHDAELLWRLMTEVLGYERFAIAGGDGGSPLAQLIAIDHPGSVIGIYLTDLGWQASSVDPSVLTKKEQHYLQAGQKIFMKQSAYAMLQTTKPQTLAYNLMDSPVGLASWILDRFYFWCDSEGDIEKSFSKDELLTNIMIYWVSGTIASSLRNYRLDMKSPSLTSKDYVNVPTGLGLFPKDIGGIPPREFAERTLNVQHWKEMPRGGHFTAWEAPEPMAADLYDFFQELPLNQPDQQHAHSAQDH